jgi:membrane associated rhomboid family serine protease
MDQIATQIHYLVTLSQQNSAYLLTFIGILWAVNIINWALGSPLYFLGLIPRSLNGFLGIFIAPLLHGNVNHLFFNSIPLFLLANFVMLQGLTVFYQVTLMIVIISGSLIWCFGRMGNHIGASGVIVGYWTYLVCNAYLQGTFMAIMLGAMCIYYFGGLALSVIPGNLRESWEGHLFGGVAGVIAAYYL